MSASTSGQTSLKIEEDKNEYVNLLNSLRHQFNEKLKQNEKISSSSGLEDLEQIRTLGIGSFGRVFLVIHKPSQKYYAMKVLTKALIIKKKQVDHTLSEIKLMRVLNFPFLMPLKTTFKDNSYIYIVMPFVPGGDMFTLLKKMKYFAEPLVQFYAAQVVLALEYLHHLDVIYRDLKPENILLEKDGYIKIADFGFCKIVPFRTYSFCGTPQYLAPEVVLNKGYGKSVDWWSLGVFVYELNAGYPPFNFDDIVKNYEHIIAGKISFNAYFSVALRDFIRKLLQVDLSRRIGNLKNGTNDIKNHSWFRDINWLDIYYKKVAAPIKPKLKRENDTSNFDYIPDFKLEVSSTDEFPEEFKKF